MVLIKSSSLTLLRKVFAGNANKPYVAAVANFSTTSRRDEQKSYKLLIVGGGCGGLAAGHMFCRKLGKGNVAIIEPSDVSALILHFEVSKFKVGILPIACKP